MNRIVPPVWPYRGIRGSDAWGTGNFGARRDGGSRVHLGLDFISVPGDAGAAVFSGHVSAAGLAYPHQDGFPDLHSLWLDGSGEWKHWRAQYLYVAPGAGYNSSTIIGRRFDQGEPFAIAEDVAAYYRLKDPTRPMTNHIHLMLLGPTDPSRLLPEGLHT